jgi:hypothetical protein
MSLVSASSFVGGIKEYMYRGIQQFPLVLAMTTFLFAITTGSIAHTTLFMGIGIVNPLVTILLQKLFSILGGDKMKRSGADSCRITTDYLSLSQPKYPNFMNNMSEDMPSFWITSVGFFFGYVFANITETFQEPAGLSKEGYDKRIAAASYTLAATIIMLGLLLFARFYYMAGCEGSMLVSLLFMLISFSIGWGFYDLSIKCGARTSDMLGILSQILPASATSVKPVVCMASNSDKA